MAAVPNWQLHTLINKKNVKMTTNNEKSITDMVSSQPILIRNATS